jgi:hypothetical protein
MPVILRCPHCGRCVPSQYRTGLAPETWTCTACGRGFPFFPALEVDPVGTRWHPGQNTSETTTLANPRSARERHPVSRRSPWKKSGRAGRSVGFMVGLMLILTLFAQFLVHERAHLAAHPELRILGDWLCSRLSCPAEGARRPEAIQVALLNFDDGLPNRLRVDVELRNVLDRPQPWPLLHLAVSDRQGRILGQGRWHPTEYLDSGFGMTSIPPWLQPGERHRLRLEFPAPGRTVDGVAMWPL